MANKGSGGVRSAKYDYLIKLLLIGDSGESLLALNFPPHGSFFLLKVLENRVFSCDIQMTHSPLHLLQPLALISKLNPSLSANQK
jgi:hypothetical protein